jgi:hypothetical protein
MDGLNQKKARLWEEATDDYACEVRKLIDAAGIIFVVIFLM